MKLFLKLLIFIQIFQFTAVLTQECEIVQDRLQSGREILRSMGCLPKDYCQREPGGAARGQCVAKLENGATCSDGEMMCLSGFCTLYTSGRNQCYSCIADSSPASTSFGMERSRYCSEGEYCHPEVLTCMTKLPNLEKCADKNDFSCQSGLCYDYPGYQYRRCVSCNSTADCAEGYQCANGKCSTTLLSDGARCTSNSSCLSSACGEDGRCQGKQADGTRCHTKYQCSAKVCDFQLCNGIQSPKPVIENTT